MALSADDINALVAECQPAVAGARVENVHQEGEHNVYLTLYSPAAGKATLLLATRPRLARFCLVDERPPAPAAPPPFCEAARGTLRGSKVERCRQVSGDRVVEIGFARQAESGERESFALVLELAGGRGQLILIDGSRRVVATLHAFRREGKEIAPGEAYRFPAPRRQPPQLKALDSAPWRYVEAGDAPPLDCPTPLSFTIARRYGRMEADAVREELRERLQVALRREHAQCSALAARMEADLRAAAAGEEHRRKGELLKGALGRLKRGMTEIELENYFDEAMPVLRIELDAAASPQENLQRYFRRYQKSRRAVPILEERLARVREDIARASELAGEVEAAETLAELERIDAEVRARHKPRRSAKRKGPKRMAALGPRRFVSRDGLEILVGRNARQNDELTLRTARGNDVFMHVAGRPGGHVVVRAPEGRQVPLETLLDGAQLALYFSLPERHRAGAAPQAAGDVDYTQVKHIRKPRGAKPGLVLLATHKTLRVRLEAERLERLQDTTRGAGSD